MSRRNTKEALCLLEDNLHLPLGKCRAVTGSGITKKNSKKRSFPPPRFPLLSPLIAPPQRILPTSQIHFFYFFVAFLTWLSNWCPRKKKKVQRERESKNKCEEKKAATREKQTKAQSRLWIGEEYVELCLRIKFNAPSLFYSLCFPPFLPPAAQPLPSHPTKLNSRSLTGL